MIDLKANPFFLKDADIRWVQDCLEQMNREEKIGQLFCLTGMSTDLKELTELVKRFHPGAYLFRPGDPAEIRKATCAMQEASRLPLLFPCNLESGGNGLAVNGTFFARPLAVAATQDPKHAKRLGLVCAREGAALGCNWSLAPIVDIDCNWRNPITNVRTFGSNPDRVLDLAAAYIDGIAESGFPMAVCLKHFPGDGVDERDQHLMPTVNSLSSDSWFESYGKIYGSLIQKGASAVMAGHIMQPALERELQPGIGPKDILPASHSKNLLTGVLREKLGFNGVIITDATPMVGFSALRPRAAALRLAINAGADMIMFCKNVEEDYAAIRNGLDTGDISEERLNEAVLRQLALKASLGLHRSREITADISWVACTEHVAWAKACADAAVTLVKDEAALLPISPVKTPRIRLTVLGEQLDGGFGDNSSVGDCLKTELEAKGFQVHLYDYSNMEKYEIFTDGVADMKTKFDLSIVAANVATGSNHTTRRLDWITLMAANAPWYCRDIPTLFVSFCNPYHLFDIPYVDCYINAYSSNSFAVEAVVEKLTGQSKFIGASPVDPFCGKDYLRMSDRRASMKAIIFDLDGVLVFTDHFHYLAWKQLAEHIGIYFDEEINNRLRGVSRMASLDIVLERADREYSQAEKEAMAAEKNAAYREFLSTMTPADVSDEVRNTLTELKRRGYKLAIGSSSKNARFILARVQLLDVFDAISDGTNITQSKPDPEVFLKAAEYLREDPKDCVVVEDAYAGIDAAKAGGMTAIGIGDAAGYEKADYRLDSFDQLKTLPFLRGNSDVLSRSF